MSKETPKWTAKKAKHIETGIKSKDSETCDQNGSEAIQLKQQGQAFWLFQWNTF